MAESLPVAGCAPPPETVAALISGDAAPDPTLAVTVIAGKLDPPLNVSFRPHEVPAQVQPDPVIEVTVNPCGGSSVTITAPAVEGAPVPFDTVIAYVAFC